MTGCCVATDHLSPPRTSVSRLRQHRKRNVLQRAVRDDDQPLVAKLGGDGREHGLAQGLGGGGELGFGLRDALLTFERRFATFRSAARGQHLLNGKCALSDHRFFGQFIALE